MAVEFGEKVRRIPVYPAADGYASEGPVAKLASNEAPVPADPRGRRRGHQGAGRPQPLPRPDQPALRTRLSDRYGVPASRIAVGNGSCDILLAAGDALLEPGAEVVYAWPSFSVYPHLAAASGARAIEVPLDAEHRHDLDAMREEITVATRLVIVCNPNNPTSTALPLERDRGVRRRRPAARRRDPRRGLLRVQHPPGPRRVDRAARAAPEPRAAADVLEGLRPVRPARRLRAVRLRGFRTAVDQVRQPFFCNAAAQAAALEALNHQDEVAHRVERNLAERIGLEDGLRRLGMAPAESQANFVWFDLPASERRPGRGRARGRQRARRSAACSCAPAARWAAPARCA